jgi:hypothetical protein
MIRRLPRLLPLAALALGASACGFSGGDSADVQVLRGQVSLDRYASDVIGVRALSGGEVVDLARVDDTGHFELALEAGSDYRIEVVGVDGSHTVLVHDVAHANPLTFEICQPGPDFDLGNLHPLDWGDIGGGQGGDEGDSGYDCEIPPWICGGEDGPGDPDDPNSGPGDDCLPPPPCDPDAVICDDPMDPDCQPCVEPPPCLPGDPDCPVPCDVNDPDCDEPWPCDDSNDPHCGLCDVDGDGVLEPCDEPPPPCLPGDPDCPVPCDDLNDPDCNKPWPCDDPNDPTCGMCDDDGDGISGPCDEPPPPCLPGDPGCNDTWPCDDPADPDCGTGCDPDPDGDGILEPCSNPVPCDPMDLDCDKPWPDGCSGDYDDPVCWPTPDECNIDPSGQIDCTGIGSAPQFPLPDFGCEEA